MQDPGPISLTWKGYNGDKIKHKLSLNNKIDKIIGEWKQEHDVRRSRDDK